MSIVTRAGLLGESFRETTLQVHDPLGICWKALLAAATNNVTGPESVVGRASVSEKGCG